MHGAPADVAIAGKYRVEGVIGEGGMGRVLAARHIELGERVAIKILREVADDAPRSIERFRREARAVARIRGEHVARVLDFGILDDGRPYIVMELVEGTDLASTIDAGPIAIARAVDFVLQACEALAEAHRVGVVHRDIKPSNLRVTRRPDGSELLKVLDFGIAKGEDVAADTLTGESDVLGSPRYMSPEQIREARTVDARSDIWSLGVVFYELLTSKLPFEAFTTAGILARIAADPARPPREHRAEIPPALEDVVLRCLLKDPDARFDDVEALARALAPFGNPRAIDAADRIGRILHAAAPVEESPAPPAPMVVRDRGDDARTEGATVRPATDTKPGFARVAPIVILGAVGLVALIAVGRLRGDPVPEHGAALAEHRAAIASTPPSTPPPPLVVALSPVASVASSEVQAPRLPRLDGPGPERQSAPRPPVARTMPRVDVQLTDAAAAAAGSAEPEDFGPRK